MKTIKEKLLAKRKVDETTGCWLWQGPRFRGRKKELKYGYLKYQGKNLMVHRLAIEVFLETTFEVGEQANHIIECPNMHCFNPEHLYKGTQKDNVRDKLVKFPPKSKLQKNREYYQRHKTKRT